MQLLRNLSVRIKTFTFGNNNKKDKTNKSTQMAIIYSELNNQENPGKKHNLILRPHPP
jgi:hypothetical protein